MRYQVVQSLLYPETWHAEAIDELGRVFVTAFSGPEAERRAREYADWKNSSPFQTDLDGDGNRNVTAR